MLSVFWARETVEQDERSTAQDKSRQMGLEDIRNLLLRTWVTSIIERYITALAFVRVEQGSVWDMHEASALLFWAADSGGMGGADVSASGPSSATVSGLVYVHSV